MKQPVTATLGGKRWRIVRETIDGLACNPHAERDPDEKPTISIGEHLKGRRLLEITLHEALHAIHWEAPEETVRVTALDLARLLWREGYRITKGNE